MSLDTRVYILIAIYAVWLIAAWIVSGIFLNKMLKEEDENPSLFGPDWFSPFSD